MKPLCKEDHLKMTNGYSNSPSLNSSSRNGSDPKVCRVSATARNLGNGDKRRVNIKKTSSLIDNGGIHPALAALHSRSKSAREHQLQVFSDLLLLAKKPRFGIEWAFASEEDKNMGREIIANLQLTFSEDPSRLQALFDLSKRLENKV